MAKLVALEHAFNTDALTCGGINYWPILRTTMFYNQLRLERSRAPEGQGAEIDALKPSKNFEAPQTLHFLGPQETGLVHFDSDEVAKAYALGAGNPDVMFLCRGEEYDQLIGNHFFARFIDSIFEIASSEFNVVKLSEVHEEAFHQKRYYPSLFLHSSHLLKESEKADQPVVRGWDDVARAAVKLGLGHCGPERDSFTTWLGYILRLADGYEHVLRHMRPKAVVYSVYWDPFGHAMTIACRRLGIPTVDVQHGRLGPHHAAYTDFTTAPAQGYDCVPDYIWCWGERTKSDIERGLSPDCLRHRGVIGGNPWLERWTTTKIELEQDIDIKRLATQIGNKRAILVSLQPLPSPLTPIIRNAMRAAPRDIIWLVRTHPRRPEQIEGITKALREDNICFADVALVSRLPLFAVLEHCEHNVTYFSSTAVEALGFGVTTTLTEGPGIEIFSDFIEDGLFRYATSPEALIDSISSDSAAREPSEIQRFIDRTDNVARRALRSILEAH